MAKKTLLGAHVSISGGFDAAIENGENINATCIQIFTKSNRQWKAKPIDEKAIKKYKNRFENSPIEIVVAHASYLINLSSANPETAVKSQEALSIELNRCDQLEIPFLILHPGTQGNANKEKSLEAIANSINKSLSETKNTTLLLETMAGQGTTLGSKFEEIAKIIDLVNDKSRIGVCLDTCHIFAAGYKFRTPKEYQEMWTAFNEIIGKKYLKVIHLNDSKREWNSRVDRHEHIASGKIGEQAFRLIMQDKTLEEIPKILETPKDNGDEDDIRNITLLKNYM